MKGIGVDFNHQINYCFTQQINPNILYVIPLNIINKQNKGKYNLSLQRTRIYPIILLGGNQNYYFGEFFWGVIIDIFFKS